MFSWYVQRGAVELLPLPAEFAAIQAAGVAQGREENWLFNRPDIKLFAHQPFRDQDEWLEQYKSDNNYPDEWDIPEWSMTAQPYTCARTGEVTESRKLYGHWSYASTHWSSEVAKTGRSGKSRIHMLTAARDVSPYGAALLQYTLPLNPVGTNQNFITVLPTPIGGFDRREILDSRKCRMY